jgi:hypothetical protein
VPVPTHRVGCKTLLWATTCPDCSDRVWFFSCTCGSKVFFDQPGGHWPRHDERCIPYLVRLLQSEGQSVGAIRNRVLSAAAERRTTVPEEISRLLQEKEFAETRRETVVVVTPHDDEHVLEGRIIATNLQVNFLRRLKLEDNAVGRAFAGPLLQQLYVELRIREAADPFSGISIELECFLKRKTFDKLRLHDGCSVAVVVSPRPFPNGKSIWIATRIERL